MENVTLEIGYGWKHGVDTIVLLAKVLDERGVGCPFHFHLVFVAIHSLSSGGVHIQEYVHISLSSLRFGGRTILANKKQNLYLLHLNPSVYDVGS